MGTVPARVANRIGGALKKYQPILAAAKARDVNESDTVVIVTDLLAEMFGYEKYSEITSEHMIRSTYCDLAVKIDNALQILVEVKAIGLDLKDQYVKQAVDYAANQGAEWVALTNGLEWRVYKVIFGKPIAQDLVVEFNIGNLNGRDATHIEILSLLAKESWTKAKLGEYHPRRQALSRFCLGAALLSDPVLEVSRRELRRVNPDVRITTEEIAEVLRNEVLKREVLEGEKADSARRQVARASNRALRRVSDAPGTTPPNNDSAHPNTPVTE